VGEKDPKGNWLNPSFSEKTADKQKLQWWFPGKLKLASCPMILFNRPYRKEPLGIQDAIFAGNNKTCTSCHPTTASHHRREFKAQISR